MLSSKIDLKPYRAVIVTVVITYGIAFLGNYNSIGNSSSNNTKDIARLETQINDNKLAFEKKFVDEKTQLEARVLQVYEENRQDHRDINDKIDKTDAKIDKTNEKIDNIYNLLLKNKNSR